jgi:hypothetical protein
MSWAARVVTIAGLACIAGQVVLPFLGLRIPFLFVAALVLIFVNYRLYKRDQSVWAAKHPDPHDVEQPQALTPPHD